MRTPAIARRDRPHRVPSTGEKYETAYEAAWILCKQGCRGFLPALGVVFASQLLQPASGDIASWIFLAVVIIAVLMLGWKSGRMVQRIFPTARPVDKKSRQRIDRRQLGCSRRERALLNERHGRDA